MAALSIAFGLRASEAFTVAPDEGTLRSRALKVSAVCRANQWGPGLRNGGTFSHVCVPPFCLEENGE